MNTIDSETIIKLIHAQARSADMWIGQWEKYKDVSGVRNASLAIGKINGLFNVLSSINAGDEDMPDDIIQLMRKYSEIWDNLHISKATAQVISVHG